MRLGYELICAGFIQQNTTPGGSNPPRYMNQIATAVTDGAGNWTITPLTTFTEDQVNLELCPGFASNAGGEGISFGVASLGANSAMSITTYRNDDGSAVAVGFFFSVWRRVQYSWD